MFLLRRFKHTGSLPPPRTPSPQTPKPKDVPSKPILRKQTDAQKAKEAKLKDQFARATRNAAKRLENSGIKVTPRTFKSSAKKDGSLMRSGALDAAPPLPSTHVSIPPSSQLDVQEKPSSVSARSFAAALKDQNTAATVKLSAPKIPTTTDGRPILLSLSREALSSMLPPTLPSYRHSQLYDAIYKNGYTSFSDITVITKSMREEFEGLFEIGKPESIMNTTSADGTVKSLLGFPQSVSGTGKQLADVKVECVYIPEILYSSEDAVDARDTTAKPATVKKNATVSPPRSPTPSTTPSITDSSTHTQATLCVSSQVGCSLTCTFCHTGTQKLTRNLETWEMVSQVHHRLNLANDFKNPIKKRLTNIVLMGQGEPLYNFAALPGFMKAVTEGYGFHPSKITLSTSGVAPLIPRVATELGCSLAVSLHATNDELRSRIMPINNQYPLPVLFASIREYIRLHALSPLGKRHRRVTFEYVMLKGVNDSIQEADALVELLKEGLKTRDMRE
ncbi:hypothetical protein BCR33DRAFT_765502 [Rhizoclosmatium globosum]|uniref:Radical SAM core domain-containing protein n=1 Tax=Rhizoclosmatium globosum TaxID=329046 RepID=A0A1Y2CF88_9FUNG|nr:hypothetical protein BCR33DRAFT_765502 [Rhizoclosmatium globosum]|eukprot:ORY45738.1 hypothetical protein BCR33DRAFT_765502 [Rhizoclosmatium globosum]